MVFRTQLLVCLGAAAVLTGLAACSHGAASTALASTPAGGLSHVLVFTDDGANAKLALADQPAALMLECAHGSRTVHVTHASDQNPAPVLTLASGDAADSIRADRQAFEGQTLVLGDTATDTPALAAFRRSGVLRLGYGAETLTAGARPKAFFGACEGRSAAG